MTSCFAIYDKRSGTFTFPFPAPNAAVARRNYEQSAQPGTLWGDFPSDFAVFLVGEYDPETGEFHSRTPVPVDAPDLKLAEG